MIPSKDPINTIIMKEPDPPVIDGGNEKNERLSAPSALLKRTASSGGTLTSTLDLPGGRPSGKSIKRSASSTTLGNRRPPKLIGRKSFIEKKTLPARTSKKMRSFFGDELEQKEEKEKEEGGQSCLV